MISNHCRQLVYFILAVMVVFCCFPEQASARRRRGRYYNTNYTTNTTTTNTAVPYSTATYSKRIAPKVDPDSKDHRALEISYHYDPAMRADDLFQDRIRVFMFVGDSEILQSDSDIVAEVKLA
ncbi:MAG: hypothetical protein N2C12_11350, partial [Planctomycetales bacterium]